MLASNFTRKFKKGLIKRVGGGVSRPSSDDSSGWYRPNIIRRNDEIKKRDDLKKMKFLKGQLELNFRIEHTDPVVHQINDVTCIHFLHCLF